MRCLDRHICGDWGEADEEDLAANEHALIHGLRLLSVYHSTGGTKFRIITEHDHSITTVKFPPHCPAAGIRLSVMTMTPTVHPSILAHPDSH